MLGGNRRVIVASFGVAVSIALVAGAFLGALYAPHYSHNPAEPSYRSSNRKRANPSQIDRDRAGLPYIAERIASGADPEDSAEREKRDLAAQESMSVWAFWLLVVSSLGVLATMVGTGFLLWQIILTRRAVEDTGEATEAMREANKIAARVSAAELRPYLFVEKVTISDFQELGDVDEYGGVSKDGPVVARVTIHLRNFGRVPARNIAFHRKSYIAKLHIGRFWKFDYYRGTMMVCAPGHERKAFARFLLNASERVDFNEEILEYILRLRFTFEDDAGNAFEERSAFMLSGAEPESFYLLGDVDVAQARRDWKQFELGLADEDGKERA